MVRFALGATLLGVLAAAGSVPNSELKIRMAELARLMQEEDGRLDALDAHKRRLHAHGGVTGKSIHNPTVGWTLDDHHKGAMTHVWRIICGAVAFMMMAGLSMFEAGCIRAACSPTIRMSRVLVKHLTVACMSCLGWWVFGWSFAFSGPYKSYGKESYFMGWEEFAGHKFVDESHGQWEPTMKISQWFYYWPLCAISTMIACGGPTERLNFGGSFVFALFYASWIYPIVVAWTWGLGWLHDLNTPGYMDYAGSGIVHLTGGCAALMGAVIAGARRKRWAEMSAKQRMGEWPYRFGPQNQPLVAFGALTFWFGAFGHHCGRVLAMDKIDDPFMAAQIAMNTTIAAASGGLVTFIMRVVMTKQKEVQGLSAGIIAGFVSICACVANVEGGSACAIGCVGGLLCQITSSTLRAMKIDEPCDMFAMHGVPGMWGLFAASLFDWGEGFKTFHGWLGFRCRGWTGSGCPNDDTAKQTGNAVGANFAEMGAIVGWSMFLSAMTWVILKVCGCMKEPDDDEVMDEGDEFCLKSI